MPTPTKVQLVLLELAAAAVLGGLALHASWSVAGIVVATVLTALVAIPVDHRWLYQLTLSWIGLQRRRRRLARGPGLAGLLGPYTIEAVPGGSRAPAVGVVRHGTTWSIPLALGLDDVFNDDVGVPVRQLAELLRAEDIALSSVRLVTVSAPARVPTGAPAGPTPPLDRFASRYCVLGLDSRRAGDAVAARGGSAAAVHQIVRRCAIHAEQALAGAGIAARRLDEAEVAALFTAWMGPAAPATGRRGHQSAESWGEIRVAGVWSTVAALTGRGADLADRVARLAAAAPTPVVATTLLLRPGSGVRDGLVTATMLLRLSAPDGTAPKDALGSLRLLATAYDLGLQRLGGEQAPLLAATTPLGVGEPA